MFSQARQVEGEFIERRINLVLKIMIVFFLVFFVGFWNLQVIRGQYYEKLARENIVKAYPIPAPRGLILDHTGSSLAENRLSHNLFLTPRLSRNLSHVMQFLSTVLDTTDEELVRMIRHEGSLESSSPVMIYQDLSLAQLAYISARKVEYPELEIKQESKRSYPYDNLFAHVLGYVGEVSEQQQLQEYHGARKRDIVGQAGIERYYNRYLMGKTGYERKVVNSEGAEVKELKFADTILAQAGKTLRLGLDQSLQKAADDEFTLENKYGDVVGLNIKTGEIMLLYSRPSFNPNDFIPKISPARWKELISDPQHPLQNLAIQNRFAPGSTFKIVMTLAALQEGRITPSTTFYCGGSQFVYNRLFRCWRPGGHGAVDLHRAIEQSCDVYFYNVGLRMDIDVIAKYASMLGLGSPTGIDLPNEARGLVPSRAWKKAVTGQPWYPGETISVAIGQGQVLATALQLASMVATVASDGAYVQPHLLSAVLDANGKVLEEPYVKKQRITGISRDNFEFVKKALWSVVNEYGTGGRARIAGYDVSGKTGTVQVVGYDRGLNLAKSQKEKFGDHAWFIAFAPYDDPQLALAVFVEHGGHGAEAAAPVAKRIFETYFRDRKIPPFPAPAFAKIGRVPESLDTEQPQDAN
jgi:penicillin-binding protein 2